VHLPRAPLVRVLAQIRFPRIPELADESAAGQLRTTLRHRYPIMRPERAFGLIVTGDGVTAQQDEEHLWKLHDKEGNWSVTASTGFVALETTTYGSRDEFCERLDEVIAAIHQLFEPVVFDRLGVRYIDRLEGDHLDKLPKYVNNALLGLITEVNPPAQLLVTLTQAQLQYGNIQLIAKWGLLPPGAVMDPSVPPTQSPSWILDLDVFGATGGDFDAIELGKRSREYADFAYRFFRWAVTDELLRAAGGDL
jgi:uncharacterized protein (TIGR04255 family)